MMCGDVACVLECCGSVCCASQLGLYLFYILASTCFGSSLPSSGSFLDPSELLEIQIEWVVYHIVCGYVVCVLKCCGYVCCVSQLGLYLFYILTSTCFGSSLPYSGSFLDPSELLEIQIEWAVYHIACGYVVCVLECCGSVCCVS
jgi:hypothetical protein